MKKFILLVGQTCVGKDTLLKKINKKIKSNIIRNITTRPKRNEQEDVYEFTNEDIYDYYLNNNWLIESYTYNNWHYGTLKSSIDNNAVNITALSIERINLFYDYLKNNNLLNDTLVIYLMCPEQIRLKRYLNRLKETNQINLESFSEMVRRFNAEKTQYQVPLKDFPNIFYIDTSITKHSQIIKQIKNFIKGR